MRVFSSVCILFFLTTSIALAAAPTIYLFYGNTCPHCEKEREFLADWQEQDPTIRVKAFEIYDNAENRDFFIQFARSQNKNITGVPTTIIGETILTGYGSDETTGRAIQLEYQRCVQEGCIDIVLPQTTNQSEQAEKNNILETDAATTTQVATAITIPLLGSITPAHVSLPVLTVAIAAVDGFNPCAMWVLIFLIGLLLRIDNRKRRWLYGIAFLVASASVYFLFMAAWLELVLFLGFVIGFRVAIGLLGIGGGMYSIREWWHNKTGVCTITHQKSRAAVFQKLQNLVQHHSIWFALTGIVALAFIVNIVELVCSAGLPAIYTQVLALNELSPLTYYAYLALYITIFLIDDILVFVMAMITLEVSGLSGKFARYNHLIGGIILLLLGLLLIFKPEWIMF